MSARYCLLLLVNWSNPVLVISQTLHLSRVQFSTLQDGITMSSLRVKRSLLLEMDVCALPRTTYPVLILLKKHTGTAAQIVPSIVDRTESLTQIVRSKHWVFPAHNFTYPTILQWILRYFPLAMRLHRFHIFLVAESDFLLFPMNKLASLLRQLKRRWAEAYMRKTAPAKYHDLLVPNFDVGCKV